MSPRLLPALLSLLPWIPSSILGLALCSPARERRDSNSRQDAKIPPLPQRATTVIATSGLKVSRFLPLFTLTFTLALAPALLAGDAPPPPAPELVQRADKIVAALQLTDAAQAARVSDLVARQYAALRLVHQQRDNGLILANETPDKAQAEQARLRIKDTATARQNHLHYAYLAALSAELTPAQVDQVKDGMTYGVLPNTFKVYQEMLPNLTAEQKRQILAWLSEAREHAMDASTSDEKHGWFGKYKGRINNYLAAAGIDMKQAEKDLFARKKAGAK